MTDTISVEIKKTDASRISELDENNIPFGKLYTDHMFIADYKDEKWGNFRIVPYGDINISPANQTLHYGVSIFEGMKAYKNTQGEPVLFRPLDNFKRMNESAERMCMPELPEEVFMGGLSSLLNLDKDWIPSKEGTSLYVRPFMFSTEAYIGIKPSDEFSFMIICGPVGAYYNRPVSVKIETKYTRAIEGGTGAAKTAGNYAASLYPARLAQKMGYDQLIWTDGKEHKYIEESGTMNIMFVINGKLVTPKLTDTILHGITRYSVLDLAKDQGIEIEERRVSVEEIIDALKQGTLEDAFGVGTAATVAHIAKIGYDGHDYELPPMETRTLSLGLKNRLENVKTGKEADKFGWIYKV